MRWHRPLISISIVAPIATLGLLAYLTRPSGRGTPIPTVAGSARMVALDPEPLVLLSAFRPELLVIVAITSIMFGSGLCTLALRSSNPS